MVTYVFGCLFVCIYIHMYVCIYVCRHICIFKSHASQRRESKRITYTRLCFSSEKRVIRNLVIEVRTGRLADFLHSKLVTAKKDVTKGGGVKEKQFKEYTETPGYVNMQGNAGGNIWLYSRLPGLRLCFIRPKAQP